MLILPGRELVRPRTGRLNEIPLAKRLEWAVRRFAREDLGALWVPAKGVERWQVNDSDTGVGSATPGAAVTTGGATSTKGTPVELIASTSFDAYWISIIAGGYASATAASDGALDILIGAATEEVLIADLLMGECGSFGADTLIGPKQWECPLYIPAGSRIAARAAGRRTSTAVNVLVTIYGGDGYPPFRVGSKVTTYGMGTVPNGTAITPGASGAEGSHTQIVASTSENHFALLPSFQVTNDSTMSNKGLNLDIGVGAATEEVLTQTYRYMTTSNENMCGPFPCRPVTVDVPSGSRLTLRASNSGANDAGYDGVIHAVS